MVLKKRTRSYQCRAARQDILRESGCTPHGRHQWVVRAIPIMSRNWLREVFSFMKHHICYNISCKYRCEIHHITIAPYGAGAGALSVDFAVFRHQVASVVAGDNGGE